MKTRVAKEGEICSYTKVFGIVIHADKARHLRANSRVTGSACNFYHIVVDSSCQQFLLTETSYHIFLLLAEVQRKANENQRNQIDGRSFPSICDRMAFTASASFCAWTLREYLLSFRENANVPRTLAISPVGPPFAVSPLRMMTTV